MKTLEDRLKEVIDSELHDSLFNCENVNASGLIEDIERFINDASITYHTTAIKYLAENDASLRESLDIAAEFCTELEDINSEFLATIHMQNALRETINHSDITDVYDEWELELLESD